MNLGPETDSLGAMNRRVQGMKRSERKNHDSDFRTALRPVLTLTVQGLFESRLNMRPPAEF